MPSPDAISLVTALLGVATFCIAKLIKHVLPALSKAVETLGKTSVARTRHNLLVLKITEVNKLLVIFQNFNPKLGELAFVTMESWKETVQMCVDQASSIGKKKRLCWGICTKTFEREVAVLHEAVEGVEASVRHVLEGNSSQAPVLKRDSTDDLDELIRRGRNQSCTGLVPPVYDVSHDTSPALKGQAQTRHLPPTAAPRGYPTSKHYAMAKAVRM